MQLFVVPYHKMIPLLREVGRLHKIGELPVGNPQPYPGEALSHFGQQLGHEFHVIGVTITVGTHGHGQSTLKIHVHQGTSTQYAAASPSQRLEPFGDMFDRFAVQHFHSKSSQRRRKRPQSCFRENLPQPVRAFGQKTLAQLDRDASELSESRLNRHRQLAALLGALESLPPTTAVHQQRIMHQLHERVEFQDSRVTPMPQSLEQVLQPILIDHESPQRQHGLSQRHPLPSLRINRVHAMPPRHFPTVGLNVPA